MNAMAAGGTGRGHGQKWRILGWGGAALLLCVPAAMMRFAPQAGFDWSASDFMAMGILFALAGLGIELAVRASGSLAYRAAAAVAILTAFLTIWVNLAVGMIGSEDNAYNMAFACVLLLALAGAAVARFRARGLAPAMAVAGIAQGLVAAGGLSADPRGAIFSGLFVLLWLLSAGLFRAAARRSSVSRAGD
ncbi:MAG: hypothetical protein ACJ8EB_13610 [Allosphingosinicella sp.]